MGATACAQGVRMHVESEGGGRGTGWLRARGGSEQQVDEEMEGWGWVSHLSEMGMGPSTRR